MSAFAFSFVGQYGGRVPVLDDFTNVALQLDPGFPSWDTLGSMHNEHRIPLPRLVSWLNAQLFGVRMKSMMQVDVAILVVAAGVLLAAARTIRGRVHFADAFVPLVVLTVGQHENLLWAFQVGFILPVAIELTILSILMTSGLALTPRRIGILGFLTASLPLCGMPGVVVAFPLAVWFFAAGVEAILCKRGNAIAIAHALAGSIVLAVLGAYFVGYVKPMHHPDPVYEWRTVKYGFVALGSSWGPVVQMLGPTVASSWPSDLGLATAGFLGLSMIPAVRSLGDRSQRVVAGGMLAFLAAVLVLLAGISASRVSIGSDVPNRYATLAMPVLLWSFFAWMKFGSPLRRDSILICLLLAAMACLGPNIQYANERGESQKRLHDALFADIHYGVPPAFLAEHHTWWIFKDVPKVISDSFELFRVRRVAPFEGIAADVPLAEHPVALRLTAASPAVDTEGWVRADRMNSITVRIAIPPVAGGRAVRVIYSLTATTASALHNEAHWMLNDAKGQTIHRFVFKPLNVGEHLGKRIWLGEGVSELTFVLAGPEVAVKLESLTVLK